MLGSDEMRAWYGPDHVCLAADRGAVGTLLISDELFRYGPIFFCQSGRDKEVSAVRVIQRPGSGTFRWLRAYSRKGRKW